MATPRGRPIALALLVGGNMPVAIMPAVPAEPAHLQAQPCQGKDGVACNPAIRAATKPIPSPENRMDLTAFWKIIEDARRGASNDEGFLKRIDSRLQMLTPEALIEFEGHFDKMHTESYSWKLWGAAYLMNGGCGDDCFDYFRAWLMSRGRQTFETALKDPDTLARFGRPRSRARELEAFLYLAREAYEKKTGREMRDTDLQRVTRPELGEGWDFDNNAEMKKRYPKLFAKYRKR